MVLNIPLCLIVFSGICISASAKTKIVYPSGQGRLTQYKDLKDHPQKSKTYNEFWTYHFSLNGNMQVILNYSRADLGKLKSPVCGSDLSIIGFKGKTYTVAREYPRAKFKFSDDKQQLNVHENIWFKGALPGEHQVYFKTKKKDIFYFIDLRFTDIVPGMTWGDGVFKLGSEKVGVFIHIPRAKVDGTIIINTDTVKVSGLGYMDHTFQTNMGPKIARTGYRYHSTGAEINIGYLLQATSKYGSGWLGFGLVEKEGNLTLIRPKAIKINTAKKTRKIKVPTDMEITYGLQTVSFKHSKDLQHLSVLNEFKGVTKWAVKKFMGGGKLFTSAAPAL
ncbi:hypothetical protein ACFL5V_04380 [Fibrobacterota bacterium]